jgi:hypothetical protein
MWKTGTHFKSIIIFLFVVFKCQEISAAEQLYQLPEPSAPSDNSSCISISGKYQFNGVAVPRMPPNFRGRPFTMDVMTGLDLPYSDRNKVTSTNIQQLSNRDLLFSFMI